MNEARIAEAARTIAERKAALSWLEQYGGQLTGRDRDQASFVVRLNFASACHGAKEAQDVVAAYARFSLPEMVRSAMDCCRNDIEMAKAAIREEIESSK